MGPVSAGGAHVSQVRFEEDNGKPAPPFFVGMVAGLDHAVGGEQWPVTGQHGETLGFLDRFGNRSPGSCVTS